jgi:hypothetical protein
VLVVPKREGKREEATSLRLVVPKVRTNLKDGSATGRAAYASTHTGNGVYVNPGDSGDRRASVENCASGKISPKA